MCMHILHICWLTYTVCYYVVITYSKNSKRQTTRLPHNHVSLSEVLLLRIFFLLVHCYCKPNEDWNSFCVEQQFVYECLSNEFPLYAHMYIAGMFSEMSESAIMALSIMSNTQNNFDPEVWGPSGQYHHGDPCICTHNWVLYLLISN